ncbi:MAG: CRISPR-associated endoribonuclease Cas6 [Flammeovirgaceae bacterium]|nr:CRISPR-associated endoribonuclease Cas6 [Flammeovirgaceae bacterium]
MRFQLVFELEKGQVLPINYQYELSSWIYRVLHQGDESFADFLHSQGYKLGENKSFRLFTFSNFHFPKNHWKRIGDRIKLYCREISCTISFFVDEGAEKFIMGLFKDQYLSLGDQLNQAKMSVKRIEVQPIIVPSNTVQLTTKSPLVISKKRVDGSTEYLSPDASDYQAYFFSNLTEKYSAAMLSQEKELAPEIIQYQDYAIRITGRPPRKKGVTIKAHTKAQNKVIGYLFDFELTAPIELIEFGLQAGFGKGNSQGFGCCEVVER